MALHRERIVDLVEAHLNELAAPRAWFEPWVLHEWDHRFPAASARRVRWGRQCLAAFCSPDPHAWKGWAQTLAHVYPYVTFNVFLQGRLRMHGESHGDIRVEELFATEDDRTAAPRSLGQVYLTVLHASAEADFLAYLRQAPAGEPGPTLHVQHPWVEVLARATHHWRASVLFRAALDDDTKVPWTAFAKSRADG